MGKKYPPPIGGGPILDLIWESTPRPGVDYQGFHPPQGVDLPPPNSFCKKMKAIFFAIALNGENLS